MQSCHMPELRYNKECRKMFVKKNSLFEEDFSARKDLWDAMDVNGNGFLSLAEVTKV